MRAHIKIITYIPHMLITMLLMLLAPTSALAENDLVTCRYLQSSGNNIELEIGISSPPPTSLILVQMVPKGTHIMSSSPDFKKFNPQNGETKWHIKKVEPGSFVVAMQVDKPVPAGRMRGEIRYKDPRSGSMVKMPVMP